MADERKEHLKHPRKLTDAVCKRILHDLREDQYSLVQSLGLVRREGKEDGKSHARLSVYPGGQEERG